MTAAEHEFYGQFCIYCRITEDAIEAGLASPYCPCAPRVAVPVLTEGKP